MQILPVLDLRGGLAVRGVGGRRAEYRPVCSILADTADPLTLARAFRDRLGLAELYVADLDGIEHGRPDIVLYRTLIGEGFSLLVDAGLRDLALARQLMDAGVSSVIAGLETLPGPDLLRSLCDACGPDRVIFSLDLNANGPLGDAEQWSAGSTGRALAIAAQAVTAGIGRIIVLDLASIGRNDGVSTLQLCRTLGEQHPDVRLMTGGGLRGPADLRQMARCGVEAVLVASALHDGRIARPDIESALRG